MDSGETSMNEHELRQAIEAALRKFPSQPLADAASHFWAVLGYSSKKRIQLKPNTLDNFLTTFSQGRQLNDRYALPGEWKSIDFLFQLTDDEIRTSASHQFDFDSKGIYNGAVINSYLFLAIELKNSHYSRPALAGITREVNKLFNMPVLILFWYGEKLTLAVINRRLNKREEGKDVLEKVTLIQDIRCSNTHRAHIEILLDLSIGALHSKYGFTNFVELHAAWQNTLDTSTLNKRFFQDLANWFFWALNQAKFPKDAPKDADSLDSLSLIRLITRVIFCWFLKEKGLLPDVLFDQRKLPTLLNDLSPKESTYYKAILQNLFFATLNQEMDKREFRKDGQHFMAHNLYRYRRLLKNPEETLRILAGVPFMNGGLFECLDKTVGTKEKPTYIRIDGFSDRDDNPLKISNDLFFGPERIIDLSGAYGDNKFKSAKVAGLFHILDRYKFTVAENTPIEEEIALDPELLGKVFENLLAAYNPETGATARKQTGSFYTPREIVNYMVDESLIASLKTKLETAYPDAVDTEDRLRQLFAYNDQPHQFTDAEVSTLVEAIDHLKILDPACGSGAFPMGILHKLVFVLGKLDSGNQLWQARQLAKGEDASSRKQTEKVFVENCEDYGRKLYLIENCIYGVDIQPIAVQISKLRFFISLVVDQKMNVTAENMGIRPLPNLETKFVAANTLIGVDRPSQLSIRNPDIDVKEAELRRVRERHFLARTPTTKAKCREQDAKLRSEIATLLKDGGWDISTAKKIASWDPYDQNASAVFFDAEWMFGILEGFHTVIANPPYVDSETMARIDPQSRRLYASLYAFARGNWDLFILFIEKGYRLLAQNGMISFIVPNKLLSAPYSEAIRKMMVKNCISELRDYSRVRVFKDAAVYPVVFVAKKSSPQADVRMTLMNDLDTIESTSLIPNATFHKDISWDRYFSGDAAVLIDDKCSEFAPLEQYFPRISGAATVSEAYEIKKVVHEQDGRLGKSDKRLINTGTIDRYCSLWGSQKTRYLKGSYTKPVVCEDEIRQISTARFSQACSNKIIIGGMTKELECFYDEGEYLAGKSTVIILEGHKLHLKYALAILNSTLVTYWYKNRFKSMMLAGGYLRIGQNEIRCIPVPQPSEEQSKQIIAIVDQILYAKQSNSNSDTSALERQIDRHVYALYGLTQEEIKIVERSLPSSDETQEDEPEALTLCEEVALHPVAVQTKVKEVVAKTKHHEREPASISAPPIDQTERDEVLSQIRQFFSDGQARDRDNTLRDLARILGYERLGPRIRQILDSHLFTAVRRGILENVGGELSLLCRSIEQFEREFLKEQLLASLGRTWIAREEAIRNFARWLGFARTGQNIEDTARSLINGLLREGRLESDGPNLRRT